jgi:DNA-binding CsgD family transcriptional regulator
MKEIKKSSALEVLTDREFEVFIHLGNGKSPVETAKVLNLSPKTISTHRNNILEKLGMTHSCQIMFYAIKSGLCTEWGKIVSVECETGKLKSEEGKKPKEFTHVNYNLIPDHMRERLEGYLEYGWELGGFLYSILTNDLRGAVKRADVHNRYHFLDWIDFCLGELPGKSWGSPEAVAYWMKFREDHHKKAGENNE